VREQRHRRHHAVRLGRLGEHARGDQARFHIQTRWRDRRWRVEQLSGQRRPRAVGVASGCLDALQARCHAGLYEGSDGDTRAVQYDRKVWRVGGHQWTSGRRGDHVCRHQEHSRTPAGVFSELHAGIAQSSRYLVRGGEHSGSEGLDHHGRRRGRWWQLKGRSEPIDEGTGAVGASAEGQSDRVECRIGQTPLELLDHPLLPLIRMIEDGDGVGAELKAVRGAPQRGMSGIEVQHPPIVRRSQRRWCAFHRRCVQFADRHWVGRRRRVRPDVGPAGTRRRRLRRRRPWGSQPGGHRRAAAHPAPRPSRRGRAAHPAHAPGRALSTPSDR